MKHREGNELSSYLVFYLEQKGFSSSYPYQQFPKDKEAERKILFTKDDERYLLFAHDKRNYRPNISVFLESMEKASREGIASLSIFHENIFYISDQNTRLRVGGRGVNRRKLFGLELALLSYGDLTYFNSEKNLAVVHYGDVIADYELSEKEYPRERIRQADLKSIKEVKQRTVFQEFDLCVRKDMVKGMLFADICSPCIKNYSPLLENTIQEASLAQGLQFAFDELQAGNDEPYYLLSDADRAEIDKALGF